jgi:26S proteasome regulatory subunit T3
MISLVQMDGFDQTVNVKVIMATNRADTLDPALLRPGRLDRKIEFPLPDRRQKRLVFQVLILTFLPLSALTLPSYE